MLLSQQESHLTGMPVAAPRRQPSLPRRGAQYNQQTLKGNAVAVSTPGRWSFLSRLSGSGTLFRRQHPIDAGAHLAIMMASSFMRRRHGTGSAHSCQHGQHQHCKSSDIIGFFCSPFILLTGCGQQSRAAAQGESRIVNVQQKGKKCGVMMMRIQVIKKSVIPAKAGMTDVASVHRKMDACLRGNSVRFYPVSRGKARCQLPFNGYEGYPPKPRRMFIRFQDAATGVVVLCHCCCNTEGG